MIQANFLPYFGLLLLKLFIVVLSFYANFCMTNLSIFGGEVLSEKWLAITYSGNGLYESFYHPGSLMFYI